MACDEAVYLALMICALEYYYRCFIKAESPINVYLDHEFTFEDYKCKIFISFFFISLSSTLFYVEGLKSPSVPAAIKPYVPVLYLFDSVAAIGLGFSFILKSEQGMLISMVVLMNFFLLHILHTIFSAKKAVTLCDEITATIKSYLHHGANFFFLDDNIDAIWLTAAWRALSMSGHTAQGFERMKIISGPTLYRFNWLLTHARNLFIVYMLWQCYLKPELRQSFGHSAVGHVAYILVRAGPVFRLGSVYVGEGYDGNKKVRPIWQGLSDVERLRDFFSLKYPFLTIEVGSLISVAALFLYWRFTDIT